MRKFLWLATALGIIVGYGYLIEKSYYWGIFYIPFVTLAIPRYRDISKNVICRLLLPFFIAWLTVWLWSFIHGFPEYSYIFRASLTNYASVQDFFSILANLYAIVIAFLLWKGLTDYDNLKSVLRDEATNICAISDYLFYFDDNENNKKISNEIRSILIDYVENIYRTSKLHVSKKNKNLLKVLMNKLTRLDVSDFNDEVSIEELIKQISELARLRSRRATLMENKMSPFLLSIILVISFSLLIPFLIKQPEAAHILELLIFLLSFLFAFLFLMLKDIDTPLDGYWSVKIDVFREAVAHLKSDLDCTKL